MPGLPPLDGCTKVEAARPSATVLATVSSEKNAMPVLAVQPLDKGRTAVFTGDTTRKWQQGPKAMNQESPYLRFLGADGSLARRADRRTSSRVRIFRPRSTKPTYEPEEGIRISATVRDKEGQAAGNAKVTAKITGPGGKTDFGRPCGRAGRSRPLRRRFRSGRRPARINSKWARSSAKSTLTAEKLAAEVGRQNLEFEKLDLDDKLLARLAAYTKGRYLHISSADLLLDQLDRSQRRRSEFTEGKLYNPPLFWTLFVGVLSLEWILRKKYQLR